MTSLADGLFHVMVAEIRLPVPTSAVPTSALPMWLHRIDDGLTVVGTLLLVGFLTRWVFRRRSDPLRCSPVRPNQLRDDAILLVVFAYFGALLALAALSQLIPQDTQNMRIVLVEVVTGSVSQLIGAAVCMLIAARRFDGGIRRFLFGKAVRTTTLMACSTWVALIAIGLCPWVLEAIVGLIRQVIPDYRFPSHPTLVALHNGDQPMGTVLALWAGAVMVAPFAEELFFRGFLQTYLARVMRSRWHAIVLASIAFGLVHVAQPHAMVALIFLAILLGYAYEKTGSLASPILIHAAFNLKTLIWQSLATINA